MPWPIGWRPSVVTTSTAMPKWSPTNSNSLRSRIASAALVTLAAGPTGRSTSRCVEPAASFFDMIEATICSRVSRLSGRSTEMRMSSAGDRFTCPPQTRQPWQAPTTSFIASTSRSTRASTSMVSAVPAGDVIAREEVFGMVRPCAATIGTTIIEVRLPGMPPMQCLSTTIGRSHLIWVPAFAIAPASARSSSLVMKLAELIRKAAISMSE